MRARAALKSRYRSMTYNLRFHVEAKKEWDKLGATIRAQFKKKLAERLENPHAPASRLHGASDRYKIKLRGVGYRLVYEVRDSELVVSVIAVGKRERNAVYRSAQGRSIPSPAKLHPRAGWAEAAKELAKYKDEDWEEGR